MHGTKNTKQVVFSATVWDPSQVEIMHWRGSPQTPLSMFHSLVVNTTTKKQLRSTLSYIPAGAALWWTSSPKPGHVHLGQPPPTCPSKFLVRNTSSVFCNQPLPFSSNSERRFCRITHTCHSSLFGLLTLGSPQLYPLWRLFSPEALWPHCGWHQSRGFRSFCSYPEKERAQQGGSGHRRRGSQRGRARGDGGGAGGGGAGLRSGELSSEASVPGSLALLTPLGTHQQVPLTLHVGQSHLEVGFDTQGHIQGESLGRIKDSNLSLNRHLW